VDVSHTIDMSQIKFFAINTLRIFRFASFCILITILVLCESEIQNKYELDRDPTFIWMCCYVILDIITGMLDILFKWHNDHEYHIITDGTSTGTYHACVEYKKQIMQSSFITLIIVNIIGLCILLFSSQSEFLIKVFPTLVTICSLNLIICICILMI